MPSNRSAKALFGIIGGSPGTTVRTRSIPTSQATSPNAPRLAPTRQMVHPSLGRLAGPCNLSRNISVSLLPKRKRAELRPGGYVVCDLVGAKLDLRPRTPTPDYDCCFITVVTFITIVTFIIVIVSLRSR